MTPPLKEKNKLAQEGVLRAGARLAAGRAADQILSQVGAGNFQSRNAVARCGHAQSEAFQTLAGLKH